MAPTPLPHPVPPSRPLSRRRLLGGAAALGLVGATGGLGLTACGDDADGETDGTGGGGSRVLVSMSDAAASLAAGAEARLALGVGDEHGALVKDAPATLTFDVRDGGDRTVVSGLEVARRTAGLPRAYFPLIFTPASPGFHTALTRIDGVEVDAAFEVVSEADIAIPRPDQPFPAVVTPTTGAPGGVTPICTQEPPCALHEVELTTVLGSAPVALLVSTPAFCQTAICGPVLDVLLAARQAASSVTFIHVEVYESAAAVREEGPQAPLAPAVEALGLPFEPCLFMIAADGTLRRRLDVIFDETELDEALTDLTA